MLFSSLFYLTHAASLAVKIASKSPTQLIEVWARAQRTNNICDTTPELRNASGIVEPLAGSLCAGKEGVDINPVQNHV